MCLKGVATFVCSFERGYIFQRVAFTLSSFLVGPVLVLSLSYYCLFSTAQTTDLWGQSSTVELELNKVPLLTLHKCRTTFSFSPL